MATPIDHKQFLDTLVLALNAPYDPIGDTHGEGEGGAIRGLLTNTAWEAGGLRRLWRLRRDRVTFSPAGILSPRGVRTLGCVRYERLSERSKPARSTFALLTDGEEGFRVAGIYDEVALGLAWLRGWIIPGQRIDTWPSHPEGEALAQALIAVPRDGLSTFLSDRFDGDPAVAARADSLRPDGAAKVLGVHSVHEVGRMLVGIGVGTDALWLVIERARDPDFGRPLLVAVAVRPSLSALFTGARAYLPDFDREERDIFLERLDSALRGRMAAATSLTVESQRERFRRELIQRLNESFGQKLPADVAVVDALRSTLQAAPARAKGVGELVAAVLERLAARPS